MATITSSIIIDAPQLPLQLTESDKKLEIYPNYQGVPPKNHKYLANGFVLIVRLVSIFGVIETLGITSFLMGKIPVKTKTKILADYIHEEQKFARKYLLAKLDHGFKTYYNEQVANTKTIGIHVSCDILCVSNTYSEAGKHSDI